MRVGPALFVWDRLSLLWDRPSLLWDRLSSRSGLPLLPVSSSPECVRPVYGVGPALFVWDRLSRHGESPAETSRSSLLLVSSFESPEFSGVCVPGFLAISPGRVACGDPARRDLRRPAGRGAPSASSAHRPPPPSGGGIGVGSAPPSTGSAPIVIGAPPVATRLDPAGVEWSAPRRKVSPPFTGPPPIRAAGPDEISPPVAGPRRPTPTPGPGRTG